MGKEKIELIESISEYLERFMPTLEGIVKELRNENINKVESIPIVMEGLKWLLHSLVLTSDVHKIDCSLSEKTIKDSLAKLISALDKQDIVLIADILEYEVGKVAKEWREQIDSLQS